MAVKRFSSETPVFFLVGLLLSALVGCAIGQTGTVTSCEPFDDPLRAVSLDSLHPSTIVEWVQNTYQINRDSIHDGPFADDQLTSAVSWDHDGEGYTIDFSGEQAINAAVIWEEAQPTLQTVLDCLGEPEHYGVYFNDGPHSNWLFELELWYPEEGLMVEYVEPVGGTEAPTVNADFILEHMIITRPGNLESVVRAAYIPTSEEIVQDALHTVRPWPDQLDDLHITQGAQQ